MKKLFVSAIAMVALVPGAAVGASGGRMGTLPDGRTAIERRAQERRMPALARDRRDALTRALDRGKLSEAEYALERARSLFVPEQVRARYGRIARPDPRGATMILRDLAIRQSELEADDLAAARAILARPTSRRSVNAYRTGTTEHRCSGPICVHWATSGSDSPPPGRVDETLAVFTQVYNTEVTTFGYRKPKSDQNSPGNVTPETDIYLLDLGNQGIYGYCTTDDPNATSPTYEFGDMSAYCVVDNDHSPAQFGTRNTPLENLQVTAAHEFFHAIQFAYDAFEDVWLMEGTAAWIEDELYDDVNDNYQYLHLSQLTIPELWLDLNVPLEEGPSYYGTWLFFRYITEQIGTRDMVREIWVLADASAQNLNPRYSLTAIDATLRAKGSNFRWAYADFAAANYVMDAVYEEGTGYLDEVGGYPPEIVKKLTAKNPSFGGFVDLDHLTSFYVAFQPGKGIRRKFGKKARLRVTVDTPPAIEGGEASVINIFNDGSFDFAPLQMSAEGDGNIIVSFKPGRGLKKVFQTAVILNNGSIRMKDCFQNRSPFSCLGGTPLDDGKRYSVKVKVMRP